MGRANILDGGAINTDAEMAKAALLVLRRVGTADGQLAVAEADEWIEMLGLGNFLRERRGELAEFEPCPRCDTPMSPSNTGRKSDGRPFCRVCENASRRAMRQRQRDQLKESA